MKKKGVIIESAFTIGCSEYCVTGIIQVYRCYKAMIKLIVVAIVIFVMQLPKKSLAEDDSLKNVPDEIRFEATLPNNNNYGHQLPLAAHWNSSEYGNGFSPDYQIKMIEQGHYLLPWFHFPELTRSNLNYMYYKNAVKKAAELRLPITFLSTQWERYLTDSPKYFSLSSVINPNVVNAQGHKQQKVSAFGPVEAWTEIGKKWTSNALVDKLQEWYPNPPLVVFISNNEHNKISWSEVEQDFRYLSAYGTGRDDDLKRKAVGNGWIERYRALQNGMLEGLSSQKWRDHTVFIGYDAFGTSAFGRWNGWIKYSLYIPGRMEPWPLAWDGASVPYYTNNWDPSTDFRVWSPQIQAMNWVFMLKEANLLNDNFIFELSTWDGHEPKLENDKRRYYSKLGQIFNAGRYEGFIQFGMWLLRPRIVREFRNHLATLTNAEPYFMSIVRSVDRVHTDPALRKFWRKGRLVSNMKYPHPYQNNIPKEYTSAERWFLLDTDQDPTRPWNLQTEIPVFSLALVLGDSPEQEWLVYAHSPLKIIENVKIIIPNFGPITVKVTPSGCFYHVYEKTKVVRGVSPTK